MNIKKIIFLVLAVGMLVIAGIGYSFYGKIYKSNVVEDTFVYISSNADFEEVIGKITPLLKHTESFQWVAEKKNYPNKIKAGRYKLHAGMSNNELVDLLRSGNQSPIKIAFNNQDSVEKLAGRIAEQLEPDSLTILKAISDANFLQQHNLNSQTILGIFVPNSYEFYWNTSAEKFRDRMVKESQTFWNTERLAKAKKLNLTQNEVITLASIVQKETSQAVERPTVAGLYLNRLRSRWALGADPTIIFALKQKYGQDKVYKRVLNKDLEINSPYNTYTNQGLPPGPIAMPDISSIDAVLNDKRHDYYFMCASVTKLGYHEFAKTLAQHNINASKYHKWVSQQGINR